MTYAQGGLIEATDYNSFVSSVNALWGVGSGDSGYGQATTLSSVSAAGTVTATQWSDLIARLNSIRQHADNTTSGLSSPSAGDTITYLSTFSSQISTATSNRLNNSGDGSAAQGAGGTLTVSNGTGWTTTRTLEISLTWSSYNQMRYFFNTGGIVDFTAVNSSFAGNSKSNDWESLANNFGTTRIRAQDSSKQGGAGTLSTNNTNAGFYDLGTSDTLILRQYSPTGTGGYNSSYISSFARLNAAHGSSPTIIYLKIVFQDDAADTFDDTVSGTARIDVGAQASGVTYISNTWGAFSGTVTVSG